MAEERHVPSDVEGTNKTKLTPLDKYEILTELLKKHPELAAKLLAALEADRFFITVTFQKKYKPTDKHDLHHYFSRWHFQNNDVLPSLKQIVADFKSKEMKGAQIQSDDWI